MNRKKGICTGEDAEAMDQVIRKKHLAFFKKVLIAHGAPKTITDDQVRASCVFKYSLEAYKAGWADHARS